MIDALISVQKAGTVFAQLPESQLKSLLEDVEDTKLARILKHSSIPDGSDLLEMVDPSRHEGLIFDLPGEHQEKLLQFLNYPEDSAGRIMNSHFFSMPDHFTAEEGLRFLRQKAKEESIYYIYCVDEEQRLSGVVSLRDLATGDGQRLLKDFAKVSLVSVTPETPSEEVAQLVSRYDFIALPVLDSSRQILGIITVDDVLDIIEEQATADIYATAGLQESDRVYSTIKEKIFNRTPWMMLNLVLAAAASTVLSQFEGVLDELVVLAITKNIVTSTSGNTAIQSLTVMTRGLAVDDFQFIEPRKAMVRETIVGLSLGALTGLMAGLGIYLWKRDFDYGLVVGGVMAVSMVLTSVVAAAVGASVPMLLKRFDRDPAVGAGVIVTVVTDIFGFLSFLGLASLALKYFQIQGG